MSESIKWWEDEKSRKEVLDWLAGLTMVEELQTDANISVAQLGQLYLLKDNPDFKRAAKLYVEIILFNHNFDQNTTTIVHKMVYGLFAPRDRDKVDISCRNISSYAKRVGEFAKVLGKMKVETKEEVQEFLKLTKAFVQLDYRNEKSQFSDATMKKLNSQINKEISKDIMKTSKGEIVDKADEKLKNL